MIATKKGEGIWDSSNFQNIVLLSIFYSVVFNSNRLSIPLPSASALLDQSLSGTESDLENDTRIQRIPSLHHQSLHSRNVLQQPVEPAPISFISKAPQKTFNPQEVTFY